MKYKVGDKIIAKTKSTGNSWKEKFDGGILTITDVYDYYYECHKISHVGRHYLESDVVSAYDEINKIDVYFNSIMDDII